MRYLTKSRFKLAVECPTKLFYTGKRDEYRDQMVEDDFLAILAEGGYQVGELAKKRYPDEKNMETLAVIDFETTGLSPKKGARATEIAVSLIRGGVITDRYQSLMNIGEPIPTVIEGLTGISTKMVADAPPSDWVMQEVFDFVGDAPLVAHNAAFDKLFWDAELARIERMSRGPSFLCTMLLAQRIYPDRASYKLSDLAGFLDIPVAGQFHRAQANADMTADLLLRVQQNLAQSFNLVTVPYEFLYAIQQTSPGNIENCLWLRNGRHVR